MIPIVWAMAVPTLLVVFALVGFNLAKPQEVLAGHAEPGKRWRARIWPEATEAWLNVEQLEYLERAAGLHVVRLDSAASVLTWISSAYAGAVASAWLTINFALRELTARQEQYTACAEEPLHSQTPDCEAVLEEGSKLAPEVFRTLDSYGGLFAHLSALAVAGLVVAVLRSRFRAHQNRAMAYANAATGKRFDALKTRALVDYSELLEAVKSLALGKERVEQLETGHTATTERLEKLEKVLQSRESGVRQRLRKALCRT